MIGFKVEDLLAARDPGLALDHGPMFGPLAVEL